jgi:hypothetical protein
MPKHKISLGSWPENNISGFGLYSDLKVLSLVYQLNKHPLFRFRRSKKDLCKNNTKAEFNFILFDFSNKDLNIEFRLAENSSYSGELRQIELKSLFNDEKGVKGLILPNKERFNYLLWLEAEEKEIEQIKAIAAALGSLKSVKVYQELTEKQLSSLKKILNN